MRNAIIANEVDVHFQPIVNLANDQVVGFEALARWIDKDLGFVSPSTFVPLAEERGFIDALSETLLRKAAEAALSWPKELFLSFNLSSAQLTDLATTPNIVLDHQSDGTGHFQAGARNHRDGHDDRS